MRHFSENYNDVAFINLVFTFVHCLNNVDGLKRKKKVLDKNINLSWFK